MGAMLICGCLVDRQRIREGELAPVVTSQLIRYNNKRAGQQGDICRVATLNRGANQ